MSNGDAMGYFFASTVMLYWVWAITRVGGMFLAGLATTWETVRENALRGS